MKIYNPQNFVLIEGCRENNLQDVIYAISNGADVNTADICGHTPLYYAIGNDNKQMVDYLVACGADVKSVF